MKTRPSSTFEHIVRTSMGERGAVNSGKSMIAGAATKQFMKLSLPASVLFLKTDATENA